MSINSNAISFIKKYLIFAVVSTVILIAFLSLGTYLISNEIMSISAMKYITFIGYLLLGILITSLNFSKNNVSDIILRIIITISSICALSILMFSNIKLFNPLNIILMILGATVPLLVQYRVRTGAKKIRYKYKNS